MKHIFPIALTLCLFSVGCARKVTPATTQSQPEKTYRIEKCHACDAQAYLIHFQTQVSPKDLNANISGVVSIAENDKYSVYVRVGLAFNHMEVLEAVAKSLGKSKSKKD